MHYYRGCTYAEDSLRPHYLWFSQGKGTIESGQSRTRVTAPALHLAIKLTCCSVAAASALRGLNLEQSKALLTDLCRWQWPSLRKARTTATPSLFSPWDLLWAQPQPESSPHTMAVVKMCKWCHRQGNRVPEPKDSCGLSLVLATTGRVGPVFFNLQNRLHLYPREKLGREGM